ncbi:MAG TPA: hypothetical protein VGC54_09255 [Planctomycetota bacterium]
MIYQIYRGADAATALLESSLVGRTPPGVTAFVDTGLPSFTTLYYRVAAIDPAGGRTNSALIATARTPSKYMGGSQAYQADIAAFWSTPDTLGNTCLTCHIPNGTGPLDLSTYESLMIGVGTPAAPDTFIKPYRPDDTWNLFLSRFLAWPLAHQDYVNNTNLLAAIEGPLRAWVAEAALPGLDSLPPVFRFDAIENAGGYRGRYLDHQTVEITWFHALDPESLPPSGDTTNQLEYYLFAGPSSAEIDWLNPVAGPILSPMNTGPGATISTTFTTTQNRLHVVVRAVDASGRSQTVRPIGDPNHLADLALRMRNMSANEREIIVTR